MSNEEMIHRMRILECRYFSEGKCWDGQEECIYSHNTNKKDMGFQNRSENTARGKCQTENCRDLRCKLSHFRKIQSERTCIYGNNCNKEECEFKHENSVSLKSHVKGFHVAQRKKQLK